MDGSDKGRKRKTLTPSSSYEDDPCYSPESEEKNSKGFFKRRRENYADGKGKHLKGASVSYWTIHDLEKLGIHYEAKAISLSEMFKNVKQMSQGLTSGPIPNFINSLEKYTKQVLNFSFLYEPVRGNESETNTWKKVFAQVKTWTDGIKAQRDKIMKEEHGLMEEDPVIKNLFSQWEIRIDDFLEDYLDYLRSRLKVPNESMLKVPNESVFQDLFLSFTRIFFLKGKPGNLQCMTIYLAGVKHSCVPDLRFNLRNKSEYSHFMVIMFTELKQFGVKESSDDEEFDIRSKLPSRVLGQHGGELLVESTDSALRPAVLGTICLGTKVIFTVLDIEQSHLDDILLEGETNKHTCMISYTKPYDYFVEKDRNELVPILFWLGYVQSLQ